MPDEIIEARSPREAAGIVPGRVADRVLAVATCLAVLTAAGFTYTATHSGYFGEWPPDFTIFHRSSVAWLNHGVVYPPDSRNLNPPAITLAMAPLGWLSIGDAAVVWWAISLASLAGAMWIMYRTVPDTRPVLIGSLILITEAGFANVRLGQVGFVVLLLLTLAWAADRRERARAGAWLGAAVYMKPFLLILPCYLAWRRAWRALAACGATVAVLTAVGLAAGGTTVYHQWLAALRDPPDPSNDLNGSLLGFIERLFEPQVGFQPLTVLSPRAVIVLWIAIAAALLWLAYRRISREGNKDTAWAALIVWSILASPLGWVYYLSIAVPPLVAAARGWKSAACLIAAAYPLIMFRHMTLEMYYFGRLGTVTIGSTYTWCLLLMFAAALLSAAPQPARVAELERTA